MSSLESRYLDVKTRVERLNPATKLIVVSKARSADEIKELYDLGARCFGESYFEEWSEKLETLPDDIEWHFIGPMQSRKAKKYKTLLARANLIQSVDRESILSVLKTLNQPVDLLVQVNLWEEAQKGGLAADELEAFLEKVSVAQNLTCRGLMAIPPFTKNPAETDGHFKQVRKIYEDYAQGFSFDTLSIGMSSDFERAIENGATMVRVGSAIFK